jgi:hypothetical protein
MRGHRRVPDKQQPTGRAIPIAVRIATRGRAAADRLKNFIQANTGVDNSIPFSKVAAEARVVETKKRIEEFEAVCEFHFREARLEQALGRDPTSEEPLNQGDLVMYRRHGRRKFAFTWEGPAKIKDVYDSMVTLEDETTPIALEHVKRYTGPSGVILLLRHTRYSSLWIPVGVGRSFPTYRFTAVPSLLQERTRRDTGISSGTWK